MKKISDPAMRIIIRSLPWGYMKRSFLLAESESGIRLNKRAYKELVDRNVITEITRPVKQKNDALTRGEKRKPLNIKRGQLKPNAIQTVLDVMEKNNLISSSDKERFKDCVFIEHVNTERILRMLRCSDAQEFLSSAGVETVASCVLRKKMNPFVLGIPDKTSEQNRSFYRTMTDLLVKKAEQYPMVGEACDACAVFIPSSLTELGDQERINGVSDKGDERLFNDSVGILIDFMNKEAYVVFKYFNRVTVKWRPAAYRKYVYKVNTKLCRIGIRPIEAAIVLCETDGEMRNKIKYADRMALPFRHVIPLVMGPDGVETLSVILSEGLKGHLNNNAEFIVENSLPLTTNAGKNAIEEIVVRETKYRRIVINGLLPDYVIMAEMLRKQPRSFVLACRQEQADFYRSFLNLVDEDIIIV